MVTCRTYSAYPLRGNEYDIAYAASGAAPSTTGHLPRAGMASLPGAGGTTYVPGAGGTPCGRPPSIGNVIPLAPRRRRLYTREVQHTSSWCQGVGHSICGIWYYASSHKHPKQGRVYVLSPRICFAIPWHREDIDCMHKHGHMPYVQCISSSRQRV